MAVAVRVVVLVRCCCFCCSCCCCWWYLPFGTNGVDLNAPRQMLRPLDNMPLAVVVRTRLSAGPERRLGGVVTLTQTEEEKRDPQLIGTFTSTSPLQQQTWTCLSWCQFIGSLSLVSAVWWVVASGIYVTPCLRSPPPPRRVHFVFSTLTTGWHTTSKWCRSCARSARCSTRGSCTCRTRWPRTVGRRKKNSSHHRTRDLTWCGVVSCGGRFRRDKKSNFTHITLLFYANPYLVLGAAFPSAGE